MDIEVLRKFYFSAFSGVMWPTDALACKGFGKKYAGFTIAHPDKDYEAGLLRYKKTAHYLLDDKNYVRPLYDYCPQILCQTPERAIVDCIKMIDEIDYCAFLDSLEEYVGRTADLTPLYAVADFYSVPKETVDSYVAEATEE